MPVSKTESLYRLIKSMTKADKRGFRLYAKRIQEGGDLQYLKLFDLLDKQQELDETELRKKLNLHDGSKFSNLKRHLYKQILISLRLMIKDRMPNIKIREYIDFAYVLYGKGLYLQALDVLEKAKKMSVKHNTDFSTLIIVEIEKLIHSRHITRTKAEPIEDLMEEAELISFSINNRVILSNLRLRLHKLYIENGHIKNEEEHKMIVDFFKNQVPRVNIDELGKLEKVYFYQSYVWYYYILNDFENCKIYASKWVSIFKSADSLQMRDASLFMRGYHYLLTACYNLKQSEEFSIYLNELETLRKKNYKSFNHTTKILSFIYTHHGRLNAHFLNGSFGEGITAAKKCLSRIRRYKSHLDEHRIMVFYFKISWMYVGNKQANMAVKYLDEIITMSSRTLRKDIQCYARLLYLMALYDSEDFNGILKKAKEFTRYIENMEEKNKVQATTLELFKEIAKSPILDRKNILSKYHAKLKALEEDPYEKQAFNYLDILNWMEAKIHRKSLDEVIRSKDGSKN